MPTSRILPAQSALILLMVIWSAINPADVTVWWMEAAPVLIVYPLIWVSRARFPLTGLLYWLIFAHSIILLVGAHYTYAEVPLGHMVRDLLDLDRNHYDRLGHLVQGLVPAIVARELLIRTSPLGPGKWLAVIVAFSVLGISATYELLEWLAAEWLEQDADAFLATQGDQWDTQKDMALALLGACLSLTFLSGIHDRQLVRHTIADD